MIRIAIEPRPNWQERLESAGCFYHSIDGEPYWREDAAHELSAAEIDAIEDATAELHGMCLDLVRDAVERQDFSGYGFPDEVKAVVTDSWDRGDKALFGRFDLGMAEGDDGATIIKLYEYNADTPTSLPEASIWQWHSAEDRDWPDQFNSIHEKLVAAWRERFPIGGERVHFIAQGGDEHEDWGNLHYLLETAVEAGIEGTSVSVEHVGYSSGANEFVDARDRPIATAVKLYPWEHMMADEFGWHVRNAFTRWINPPWTMLLSTKALLPKLYEKFYGHALLLPAHIEVGDRKPAWGGRWARKPMLGREGANISVMGGGVGFQARINPAYDKHGYVLQQWFDTPRYDGFRPVIGSWVVNGEPAGIGIREERGEVTTNASCFVPHYFTGDHQ